MGKPRIFLPEEKVEVLSYSGYRGEETPRVFKWRGTNAEVAEIQSRWIEEGVGDRDTRRKFRVTGTDGTSCCLIYDEKMQEWFRESKGEES